MNLTSEEYMKTRHAFADDLTEGKYSFPIIHCILFGKEMIVSRLKEILKLRTKDDVLKKEAIELMRESGSFHYTTEKLSELHKEMKEMLVDLGGNPILEKVLDMLSVY